MQKTKTDSNFTRFGFTKDTLRAISKKGFATPTPIQDRIIPLLMEGEIDLIGQSHTGTGKTAAFALPILEKLDTNLNKTQMLVLTPTRELAVQVTKEIESLRGGKQLRALSVYGGVPIERQIKSLRRGIHIVVGTPGRILDHISRRTINFKTIKYLVIDEADEMLRMGFIDDVESILKTVNPDRRTVLFSATMPDAIRRVAEKYMGDYKFVSVSGNKPLIGLTNEMYIEMSHSHKLNTLCNIIDDNSDFYGLIFCKTRSDVNKLSKVLNKRGYRAEGLHGDIAQNRRQKTLSRFRDKKINLLVATDVASRGIDIDNLTHVINYSIPQSPEGYIHRIGRTGRAGKEGTAITFITPEDHGKFNFIKRASKSKIKRANFDFLHQNS